MPVCVVEFRQLLSHPYSLFNGLFCQMKAELSAAQFSMKVSGDTGYNNKSWLELSIQNLGNLELPNDQWDISPIVDCEIVKLTLGIPSGTLTIYVQNFDCDGTFLTFNGHGVWEGKYAGLLGGMSGYGDFQATVEKVVEGTYILPSDKWGQCDIETYLDRIKADRLVNGYEQAVEKASKIAEIIKFDLVNELGEPYITELKEWYKMVANLPTGDDLIELEQSKLVETEPRRRQEYE